MVRQNLHKSKAGWALFLLLGLFSTLLLTSSVTAEDEESKEEEKKEKKIAYPRLHELPSNADSDVVEAVRLINAHIEEGWRENEITPSRPANDFEFIRRATLDIVGRIASIDEIKEYARWPKDKRRSMLIEKLLSSPDYARNWSNLWSNWLLGRAGTFGTGMYHDQMATWLEDKFALNVKWDKIVTELLTAKGTNTESGNGAVNFILAHVGEAEPRDKQRELGQFQMVPITSRITRLFLGIQTQCTQCHDHPFDANLRQEHFWGINAFLRQVERQGTLPQRARDTLGPLTLRINTNANASAIVRYEKRNGVLLETKARFLNGKRLPREMAKEDRRPELAKLIIDHPSFPKAMVNRMWGTFMGKGFVNPIDDFNDTNEPSHPELLDELAKMFKHYNYDLKKLIRWICNSDAYHLSAIANKTNDKRETEIFFSRMLLKSMTPEQLFESLMVATKSEQTKEARKELRDKWLGTLVSNFGDDEGNEVNFNGTIVQALLMMNGDDLNKALAKPDSGTVAWVLKNKSKPHDRLNYLYLAALNRPITPREERYILQPTVLGMKVADKNLNAPYQDIFWALVNSNEFILNH